MKPACGKGSEMQATIVAAEPLAARAGLQILEQGGNAVDAAVTVGFALAVTFPEAGNIGGGGFLVGDVGRARGTDDGQPICLDFREKAPLKADRDLYVRAAEAGIEKASLLGHLAAAVPGSVAGLLDALDRWGSLPRSRVLAPAIGLASRGFPMTASRHRRLSSKGTRGQMTLFEETARIFYPDGEPVAAGEIFKQPDLARTLQRIADNGREGFYGGETADHILVEMKRGGGLIAIEDLESYRAVVREPVQFELNGVEVLTMPAPSSGGICLEQMLRILSRFPLEEFGAGSTDTIHLLAESMRRSFADRNHFLGDPDFVSIPTEKLLSEERIEAMAKSIDLKKSTPSSAITPAGATEKEETTHYSILDRHGNAVAVTTTLNGSFGSKVVVPGTGFLLNNEMDDFTARPGEPNLFGLVQGEANAVEPGKRPLSSMTPTVVIGSGGEVRGVLGTPGGPTIITNVLQVFLGLYRHNLSPEDAVSQPKVHHQSLPDHLYHEEGIAKETLMALKDRGHQLKRRGKIGDFQLISVAPGGAVRGVSDPRGGGTTATKVKIQRN
ncbi:MAG TPA: gamma-glutamyltransferase [Planctomycetes bacterium]|nr:gamma-glutamyltransferase [Planctomycetota bacterium]HIN81111.1 gamma-glutamyltransferase [Planctomycetota bacterium]